MKKIIVLVLLVCLATSVSVSAFAGSPVIKSSYYTKQTPLTVTKNQYCDVKGQNYLKGTTHTEGNFGSVNMQNTKHVEICHGGVNLEYTYSSTTWCYQERLLPKETKKTNVFKQITQTKGPSIKKK